MNDKKSKLSFFEMLFSIIVIILLVFLVKKGINVLKDISQICIVEDGSLRFEENANGYILRDETVLKGENQKNGMVQLISEGQRVAKDKPVFRYYSNGENEILKKISLLDDEINAEIASSGLTIFSTDIKNIESQIEKITDSLYNVNYLEELNNKISELETYMSKKTKITGSLSPSDSHVKTLIDQRNTLESQLSNASEVIKSPCAGLVSYRVDGLEEMLRRSRF